MTNTAQTIVRGKCISNMTQWEHGEIWTITLFGVAETWKGAQAGQISVRLLGGTVGGLTSNVAGVPRFREGEQVILFLEPTKHDGLTVVGWQQGTFRIRRDLRTGAETVTQDTATFAIFDRSTKSFQEYGIHDLPLTSLRSRVEQALAESRRKS